MAGLYLDGPNPFEYSYAPEPMEEAFSIIKEEVLLAVLKQIISANEAMGNATLNMVDLKTLTATLKGGFDGWDTIRALKNGKYEIREIKGVRYVILRGRTGFRDILKGTKYALDNPKIVKLGIGPEGIKAGAKAAFILTMVFTVAIDIAEFMADEWTATQLAAHLTVDISNAVLSGYIGIVAGAVLVSFGAPVALVVAGGLLASMGIGALITLADNHFGIAKALASFIDKVIVAVRDYGAPHNQIFWGPTDPKISPSQILLMDIA